MLQGQNPAHKMMHGEQKKTAPNIQEHVENSRMFFDGLLPMCAPSIPSVLGGNKGKTMSVQDEEFIMWLAVGCLVSEDEVLE